MRKIVGVAALLFLFSTSLYGEVRVGGLFTPKSANDETAPLGQALFLSVGGHKHRLEFYSDLFLFRSKDFEEEGSRHTEDEFTIFLGYRRTIPIDAVSPSLTFRAGYHRAVLEEERVFFGTPVSIRLIDEEVVGMFGIGLEYQPHRRVTLGMEAGFWGKIINEGTSNWSLGIQFPTLTAAYSFL